MIEEGRWRRQKDREKKWRGRLEVDREIEEKEEELKQLMKEVDELQNECIEEAVRIESGDMGGEERAKAVERQNENEIKKLDWDTEVDERKEGVRLLKKKREDLEGEVKLIKEYIEKYREEEQEKRKRAESDDNDNDDDREVKKWKPVSISLKLYHTLSNYIKHIFFFMTNVLFFVFCMMMMTTTMMLMIVMMMQI